MMDFSSFPFVPAAIFVAGVALVAWGASLRARAREVARWVAVQGRVYHAGVRVDDSPNSDGGTSRMYRPDVRYTYVVGGQEYASSRLDFLDRADSWQGFASEVAARYPEGTEVTVYHDPADPRRSVLERHAESTWAGVAMAAGVLLALGAIAAGWEATIGAG